MARRRIKEPLITSIMEPDYEDKVLLKLQKLQPGARVRINGLKNPERFRKAVIYLMDFGAIDTNQYVFNADYTVLKKHEPVDFEQFRKKR